MKNKKGKFNYVLIAMALFFLFMAIFLYKQSIGIKVLESVEYTETSNVKYKVYLNENKYYDKDYLEEGMQYISGIIDYIDLNFNYNVSFDKNIDYTADTQVVADIKIVDANNTDNVIYKSQEILSNNDKIEKKDSTSINLSKNLKIDYQKYNSLTNEFKSNYGISADCKLIVNFYTTYQGKYKDFNNMNRSKSMIVEIPLSKQMITINKPTDSTLNDSYSQKTNTSVINKTLFMISIIFLISFIVTLLYFISLYIKTNKNTTKYNKYLNKILRQYDSYITESKGSINVANKNLIRIKTFKELLDVRNNVDKTIIYVKADETHSQFLIIDEAEIYCYSLKEEDFR